MKELFVKYLHQSKKVTLGEASHLLETNTVAHPIDMVNWKEFGYKPKVSFRVGHTREEIWLRFEVAEKHIRALETRTNGDVYKDSCVEFFISFDNSNYYNFEFNCIGTRHLAFGPGRRNRKLLPDEIVEQIQVEPSLGNLPFDNKSGDFEWQLMVQIPIECFQFSNIKRLSELKATANFYKCGDETAQPHFVTWSPVGTEKPDYHRPEFFGKVWFE